MDTGTISWLITIAIFGAIGWVIASKRARPAGLLIFILLLLAAIVGFFVGRSTRLVDMGGFAIFLNWSIVSCCIGGGLGLLRRNQELRRIETCSTSES